MDTVRIQCSNGFEQWRDEARRLLSHGIPPEQVRWDNAQDQLGLFDEQGVITATGARPNLVAPSVTSNGSPTAVFTVPRGFMELARLVAAHRDEGRWELLYRTLWRMKTSEPHLLEVTTDDDVYRLTQMGKAVSRDLHKMKAFVRFRKVDEPAVDGHGETFVAWHRPDHYIVQLAAPFFARRFPTMNWSIFTPDASVYWNQHDLVFGPGVQSDAVSAQDGLEELWKTYYASIFNPARIKVAAMKREMPRRHWPTLPETSLIPELLDMASSRVQTMIDTSTGFAKTAAHFIPTQHDQHSLAQAARGCTACDLYRHATQCVFGEGPGDAKIVLVGEQPGDREDREGHPFVGPAGELLDQALEQAGINRADVYITNVVKHFKFTMQGKRRLHKKPGSREIYACRPWLEAELSAIKPQALICLGATPAQALLGRDFRIMQRRGQIIATDFCAHTIATWHPAAILRMADMTRKQEMVEQLVSDLRLAI